MRRKQYIRLLNSVVKLFIKAGPPFSPLLSLSSLVLLHPNVYPPPPLSPAPLPSCPRLLRTNTRKSPSDSPSTSWRSSNKTPTTNPAPLTLPRISPRNAVGAGPRAAKTRKLLLPVLVLLRRLPSLVSVVVRPSPGQSKANPYKRGLAVVRAKTRLQMVLRPTPAVAKLQENPVQRKSLAGRKRQHRKPILIQSFQYYLPTTSRYPAAAIL